MVRLKDYLIGSYLRLHHVLIPTHSVSREDQNEGAEQQAIKKRLRKKFKGLLSRRATSSNQASLASSKPSIPLLRLPLEIRLMIWEYAIGGTYFKLEHKPKTRRDPCIYTRGHIVVRGAIIREQRVEWSKYFNHLSLAFTCHQIHHEVFDVLYARNVFALRDPEAVVDRLTYRLLPSEYRTIRILELTWSMESTEYDPTMGTPDPWLYLRKDWVNCFNVVMSTLRLSSLRVVLKVPLDEDRPRNDLRADAGWIQPLFVLEQLKNLEIVFKFLQEGLVTQNGQLKVLEGFARDVVLRLKAKGNEVASVVEPGPKGVISGILPADLLLKFTFQLRMLG
ncbi:MAG: hypothetical protein L6R39_004075 [Caloplaca ligustica]|nr:MAG: hypothetical protein L6R39_004075 [Caloplaca ligustica]